MREADQEMGTRRQFEGLWRELSEEWVHLRGASERFWRRVEEREEAPSWALMVPMPMGEGDRDDLLKLGAVLMKLGELLKATLERYQRTVKG